jgi:hypothetical protein
MILTLNPMQKVLAIETIRAGRRYGTILLLELRVSHAQVSLLFLVLINMNCGCYFGFLLHILFKE